MGWRGGYGTAGLGIESVVISSLEEMSVGGCSGTRGGGSDITGGDGEFPYRDVWTVARDSGCTGPRSLFSVIVDITEPRLVVREGRSGSTWRRCPIDDVGRVTIEGVVIREEGESEDIGLAGLTSGEHGEFKGERKVGEVAISVEATEEGVPYRLDVGEVETSFRQALQSSCGVEISEEGS